MKLFLSSLGISGALAPYFSALVGKNLDSTSIALIENAADPYPEENRTWMKERSEEFVQLGISVKHLDLRDFIGRKDALYDALHLYDVIWIGGGNTFYLRWILRESGLDTLLPKLLVEGKVYGGGSAGAIVVGPTLRFFDAVDDPALAPELIKEGLGLHENIIVPHWGDEKYATQLEQIRGQYKALGYPVYCVTDREALVISGEEVRLRSS